MVIKMLTELGRSMGEYTKDFSKETGNERKSQVEVSELEDAMTELRHKPAPARNPR